LAVTVDTRCPYARTVTPASTYVKHEFCITDQTAEVKRNGNTLLTLTEASAEFTGTGKNRTGRIEGTNVWGKPEIWNVVCSCGCGEIARIMDTEQMYVPT
jgi:hypothetical protein